MELGEKTNFLLQKSKCAYIHLPFTNIIKTEPPTKALQNIHNLSDYDLLIFTSQSAVINSAEYCKEFLLNIRAMPILAIGLATQELLQRFELPSSLPPTFDSAGLACTIKEKDYKKCLVFCGEKNPRILDLTDADIDTFPCYASNDEENIDQGDFIGAYATLILPLTTLAICSLFEAREMAMESDNTHSAAQWLINKGCEYLLMTGTERKDQQFQNHLV